MSSDSIDIVPEVPTSTVEKSLPQIKSTDNLTHTEHDISEPISTHPSSLLKEEKVARILLLKDQISTLVTSIRNTKIVSEKYENDIQYLQEYIGSLMKNEDTK